MSAKHWSRKHYHAVRAALHAHYPQMIPARGERARPLAIGVRERLAGEIGKHGVANYKLRSFFWVYTRRKDYLVTLKVGTSRVDLDGSMNGEVTIDEQQHAEVMLAAKEKA